MAAPRTVIYRGREYREEPAQSGVLDSPKRSAIALAFKRLIDIGGAVAGLTLGAIAYLIYNRRIRRESGSSVIFRQERVGELGRVFEMYKFRTMKTGSEVALEKLRARNEMRGPVFKIRQLTPSASNNPAQAALTALGKLFEAPDVITASGQLDVLRYGHIFKARQLAAVRGAGLMYDGKYYVKSVTHSIKRGEYKQSFTLARGGVGSSVTAVSV